MGTAHYYRPLAAQAGEAASAGPLPGPALVILDPAAIEKVCEEAWPRGTNVDELHEALLLMGAVTDEEIRRIAGESDAWIDQLVVEHRAGKLATRNPFWIAAERQPMLEAIYSDVAVKPALTAPEFERKRHWEHADAVRELVRGRMEVIGPTTASLLTQFYHLPESEIQAAVGAN